MKYDFDTILDRQQSESIKWLLYDKDVLPMWIADMDFVSPPAILDALHKRIDHGVFGYPTETDEMKEVIVDWMARRHQWHITAEEILFFPGVVSAFNLVSHAVCQPGDGVLLQTPAYPPFLQVASNVNLVQQENELIADKNGYYQVDFDAFEKSIEPNTKLFILCNPQNPAGRVFTKFELEKMAEICLSKGVTICSDEIHSDLIYSGYKHLPIASLNDEISNNTVTLMAPSKTFNIAGLEASMIIVKDKDLRERIKKAGGGVAGWVNLLALVAMTAAYRDCEPWLDELMVYLEGNRDFLFDTVNKELPGISMGKPEGTYLAWLDCRAANLPEKPSDFFLKYGKLAVNDGHRFAKPGEGFVRLNYGCPRKTLEEGLERMKTALKHA